MDKAEDIVRQESRKRFLDVAEEVLKRFILLPENPEPERKGCYICVMTKPGPKIFLVAELGNCGITKADKYFNLSQEKVHRLLSHGHFSSWQSRDISDGKYGGAITAPLDSQGYAEGQKMAIGISGFTEEGDEAVALVIGLALKWIVLADAELITGISGNKLFIPLMEACADLFE